MASPSIDELLSAIRHLPLEDRLRLIERARREATEDTPAPADARQVAPGLWRLERWKEAKAVFERMLWLNPSDNQGVRFCLPKVRSREAWTDDEF